MFRCRSTLLAIVLALTNFAAASHAATVAPRPVVTGNIHYREALFHAHQDDHFPAIVRLLTAREAHRNSDREHESELMLASLLFSYGQVEESARTTSRLLGSKPDQGIRDQALLLEARLFRQRGYLD